MWSSSPLENKVNFKNFWYIACQSKELTKDRPLARTILDEWIVLFRDTDGSPAAFQDRCIHRNYQLSKGAVKDGCLRCPYHGWTFDKDGSVVNIPAEGPHQKKSSTRSLLKFECIEQDDFIYVRLENNPIIETSPFSMPHYKEPGYKTVRLFNIFKNNVTNCAENYVDVPHTVFVHDEIFRVSRQEKVDAICKRKNGSVEIEYKNETNNLGWFSWFLNPKGGEIIHKDFFHMPNITSVEYIFSPGREFFITSQTVPIDEFTSWVFTDLTFKFGAWNFLAAPIVRYQGQSVIDQDIVVLDNQMKVIKKYGTDFSNSKADIVHVFIESIREEIEKGIDPRLLKDREQEFEFWV
ncbi:MAG: phenylpropionate dioxygenase-like ring-hydroxylating dioxygenase large terminal subunit [Bacteriovoracaceae bacterium]|jgi:phenylpropionate dioxygenase-like ring-hydroxylating dioxygenase large terminal subunit